MGPSSTPGHTGFSINCFHLPTIDPFSRAGVGLKVGAATGEGRLVTATISGSTAEAAGVSRGDIVLSVDDVPAASVSPDVLQALFRGPVGTSVDVTIRPHAPLVRNYSKHFRGSRPDKDLNFRLDPVTV